MAASETKVQEDLDLQKIREKKKVQYQQRAEQKNFNPWASTRKDINDFADHFLPTDDIYGSAGTGDDSLPALAHFQWLAERRIGAAYKIAKKPAEDAVRNRFKIASFKGEIEERDDIFEWCEDTDLFNQIAMALFLERVYGCAFLIYYYTEHDKEFQDLSKPAPKGKKPVAFQAFPPTHMSPTNVGKTFYLDTDPQSWDLQGGNYNSTLIHHTRKHVFMTRPVSNRWRGLSVYEPIWISLMAYFQALIYLLKAFSKMGAMIPYWLIDTQDTQTDVYNEYASLLEEMKMNGVYIGKMNDKFGFAPTNIAAGLTEMMEIWKEDISAGCSIPVPIIWGRVTAAGLSGAAYLMAERYYWNEVSNIQASISDDMLRIFKDAHFKKLERCRIDWSLAITKTDQQRLVDEGLEIENEILKEQLLQSRFQTDQLYKGNNLQQQKPNQPNEQGEDKEGNEKQPVKKPGNGDKIKLQELENKKREKDMLELRLNAIRTNRLDMIKAMYQ